MANDDLDQFPTPPQAPGATPQDTPSVQPPAPEPAVETFEPTPDEIPSINSAPPIQTVYTEPPQASQPQEVAPTPPPAAVTPPTPLPVLEPELATLPQSSSSPIAPIIFIVLLFITVGAVAGVVFLANQTSNLKNQLSDITQTLQRQQVQTTPTPSPSPVSSVELTPTPTLLPTPTSTISASPTPAIPVGNAAKPLSIASSILQTAIKHSPNAQLILIKSENSTDPVNITTKYFFRVDLTTKKYFYILVDSKGVPQVVDKQIYVTPDDNIPSINDAILTNQLGIDLDAAIAIAVDACPDKAVCATASVKGQYIKSAATTIWQITMTIPKQTQPYVIQINVDTKEIIFRSANLTS